ncbi:MAG: ABC transporter ATP-binding protein/permease [Oscillospiraceae bacterium]|nr:ABC transporter ATP-binding protein/permease [Oscillospiraceae bacterium]
MLKLKGYMKPFAAMLLAAVVLLFAQAMCDLNLPNLLSDIVNVGIQQNGIERAAPGQISAGGMALITKFMTGEQKRLTYESYTAAHDGGYILNADTEALDSAFGSAAYALMNTLREMEDSRHGMSGQQAELDMSRMHQLLPMLEMIPQSVVDGAIEQAARMDGLMLNQVGIAFANGFLTEAGVDVRSMQTAYIIRVGLNMLLLALLGGAATITVSLISSRVAAGVARDLRADIFEKVESFSNAEFDRFSTASLITRSTNDVTQIQMLLMFGIRMVCYAPIMAVGGIIMAVGKSAAMSWIIAVAVLAILCVILIVFVVALPKFKLIQKLTDKLNLVSRENLTGMMVIRALGTREHEKRRFDGVNREVTDVNRFVNRVMVTMMPFMMLLMNGVCVLIVWVGAGRIDAAAMQVGDLMAYIQYAMQVIMSFLMIAMMFIFLPRAAVSADRIAEVLETEAGISDPGAPRGFDPKQRGRVEFKNVSFRYGGAEDDALHDITFTAAPGGTTAIIGPTGAGKSTLVNLIMRFYDVTGGELLVGGADVREVRQKDLRERIGYVPQKGVLMTGTVASNLRYGNRAASDAEIAAAAGTAQAEEFISEMPEGFESLISQGGANVSGGQKQRLSIARALVRQPDVLIFDDSFSALDFKTDAALRRALKGHGSTVIIVAQRVNTIMNADQIIVLEHGRIVGMGTHKRLLKTCPQYYEIASTQLSGEELE